MQFKKGMQLGDAPTAVMAIILIAVTAVVGQKVMTQVAVGETAGGSVAIAAGNASGGISQITTQLPLVGLIVIMAIVIGVLWSSFRFGGSGGM
jgi:hypothetical protein